MCALALVKSKPGSVAESPTSMYSTVSEEFPPVIANIGRQRRGARESDVEQLVETDVYVADHSLHSDIARQTGKPPRSADANFERLGRFAPRLWRWRPELLLKYRTPIPRKGLASRGRSWRILPLATRCNFVFTSRFLPWSAPKFEKKNCPFVGHVSLVSEFLVLFVGIDLSAIMRCMVRCVYRTLGLCLPTR